MCRKKRLVCAAAKGGAIVFSTSAGVNRGSIEGKRPSKVVVSGIVSRGGRRLYLGPHLGGEVLHVLQCLPQIAPAGAAGTGEVYHQLADP